MDITIGFYLVGLASIYTFYRNVFLVWNLLAHGAFVKGCPSKQASQKNRQMLLCWIVSFYSAPKVVDLIPAKYLKRTRNGYLKEVGDPSSSPQKGLVYVVRHTNPLSLYWFWVTLVTFTFHVVETPRICSFKKVGSAIPNPAENCVNLGWTFTWVEKNMLITESTRRRLWPRYSIGYLRP